MTQQDQRAAFVEAGKSREVSLFTELMLFLMQNKKWWMAPILLALAVVGVLAALAATGAAPFIYTLF